LGAFLGSGLGLFLDAFFDLLGSDLVDFLGDFEANSIISSPGESVLQSSDSEDSMTFLFFDFEFFYRFLRMYQFA